MSLEGSQSVICLSVIELKGRSVTQVKFYKFGVLALYDEKASSKLLLLKNMTLCCSKL